MNMKWNVSTLLRIWTRDADSISYDDKHFAKHHYEDTKYHKNEIIYLSECIDQL